MGSHPKYCQLVIHTQCPSNYVETITILLKQWSHIGLFSHSNIQTFGVGLLYSKPHFDLLFKCRSESPSQVFLIVLQWLFALLKSCQHIPQVTLAYDNMCNLARLKVAQRPLPLPPPLDLSWSKVEKVIDVFHFANHISPECKKNFNPDKLKKENPHFNTQASEQTFVWVGRFKHILCSMNKNHHLFYLHRMVLRRNTYTTKCYRNGRKPILPKSST